MFVMTTDIEVGDYKVKPSEVKWKCSLGNFTDTCSIYLPLSCYTRTEGTTTDGTEETARVAFKEGMRVNVSLGYDGANTRRFVGFVSRINYSTPLELECEGYSYQLRKVHFTKSYTKTTVRQILQDLIAGTDIKLAKEIPNIPLQNVWFKDCPGIKVLEWFQKECLCSVFFDFDTLFVGASRYAIKKEEQKIKLGWNTVEDKELKKAIDSNPVQINIVAKDAAGTVKKVKSTQRKYTSTKEVKVRAGMPADFLKQVAAEMQADENNKAYNGSITCFLVPSFEKSMVADITDDRFHERAGKYFVETIEGSYSSSGGRQKLTLKRYANE